MISQDICHTLFFKLIATLFIYLFIYLSIYLAVLGLHCCAWAFSSCGERGLLFIVVASLVTEHGLQAHGLSSCGAQALQRRLSRCGTQAQLLRGMWYLPGPGLEPMSPALAGRFLTTAPPGKPCSVAFQWLKTELFSYSSGDQKSKIKMAGLHSF